MKKYVVFLLLIGVFGLFSCSNDDDNEGDPVIGTWILQNVEPNTTFNPQDCGPNSTVRILGDNSLTASLYFLQNNCALISGDGSWQNTGASTYTFNLPEAGEIQGTATFPGDGKMVFTSENDLVFTFQLQL